MSVDDSDIMSVDDSFRFFAASGVHRHVSRQMSVDEEFR
jgi:hypothetical protein